MSDVLHAVVAHLRAGAAPGDAWGRVLGGVPADMATDLERLVGLPRERAGLGAAVVAAARLSADLGAPLADVLERLAAGLAAQEEADADVRAAVAGPRATARVVSWLPVFGLLLGAALGADPLDAVLSSVGGAVPAAAGVVLLVVGQWWMRRLVETVRRAGETR